jgi:hypothetical protein
MSGRLEHGGRQERSIESVSFPIHQHASGAAQRPSVGYPERLPADPARNRLRVAAYAPRHKRGIPAIPRQHRVLPGELVEKSVDLRHIQRLAWRCRRCRQPRYRSGVMPGPTPAQQCGGCPDGEEENDGSGPAPVHHVRRHGRLFLLIGRSPIG